MIRLIRNNVFETNSSSTHSLTIVDSQDFIDWVDGLLYYNPEEEIFVKADFNKEDGNDLYTYEEWEEAYVGDYFETFSDDYTTKSGDSITAFGYYGHD